VLRSTKGLLFVGVLCCYNLGGPKTSSYVTVGVRRGGGGDDVRKWEHRDSGGKCIESSPG
jgi:hypothetical protein